MTSGLTDQDRDDWSAEDGFKLSEFQITRLRQDVDKEYAKKNSIGLQKADISL